MKKNIKGATLIEIVISLLLVSLFLAFIGSFFISSGKYFERTKTRNEDKLIGDSIAEFIENTIKFAGKIEIVKQNETSKYENSVSIKNNKLAFKNKNITNDNIYSDSFYDKRKLSYIVSNLSDTSIEIKVNVLNSKDKNVYTAITVISFPNLILNANAIEMSQDNITNAKISYEESEIKPNEDTGGLYIPGTNVKVNSNWPAPEEFYDSNGFPKGVAFAKGTTLKYDGKYYMFVKSAIVWYIGWGNPKPQDIIDFGYYRFYFIDISRDTVFEYGVDNLINIKRGDKVLKDGKYYVYNADGFWGDIPPHYNYVELKYPLE